MAMRHFDTRDGLPQSQVTNVLEDRHGFIWAGTADGLIRLGPNGSQLFDATTGFRTKDIYALIEDHEGAIWVGGADSGIHRIQGRLVTNFGPKNGLRNETVFNFLETHDGVLLAGSKGGLVRRRGDVFESVPLPEPWGSGSVMSLAEDGQGWVWLGSRKGALARWKGARLEPVALPAEAQGSDVLDLKTDPSGQVWALQAERLLRQGKDGAWAVVPLPGLPQGVVLTKFAFDRSGELILPLWSDGLYLLSAQGQPRVLNARNLLCRDSITCALRDRKGCLWIGTNGDYLWTQPFPGLSSLCQHPDTGANLGLGTVTSFLEQPGHRMLMGSNNGVFLWDAAKGLIQSWKRGDGLVSDDVWALQPDDRGGTWVGTMKGLYRLGQGGRLLPGPKEMAKVHIQCMAQEGQHLWAGTDKGLAELDVSGRFVAFHAPVEDGSFPSVHALLVHGEELLVGTSVGLFSFKNGTFKKAYPDDPFGSLQVLAIHQDVRERLWVGTAQSLMVRDPAKGTWSSLGLEAGGQPLYSITWIRSLRSGAVAIGHPKGVTLVDPTGKSFHLTRRMGLLSDETNQSAAVMDQEGRLWIGMVGGVCILDDLTTFPTVPLPQPVVLDVSWERGTFTLPSAVTLPRGFASLAVHVDAGGPNSAYPVRFEAKLEDPDGPWRPLEPGVGSIYYGGLSPGTHRLHFRASCDGLVWQEAPPIQITIRPAWYQTLWAKGALVLLVLIGGAAFFRMRIRLLEHQNLELEDKVLERTRALEGRTQELAEQNQAMEWTHRQLKETLESRMRMINTVSHDLRSPLTSILLSVERIQDLTDNIHPQVQKAIGIMGREAHRLNELVKGLLDQNRAESLTDSPLLRPARPRDILESLEDTLSMKAEDRGLRSHLYIEAGSQDAEVLLDVRAMRQVLFNLVENALKFTDPPGDVGVRSSLQGRSWILEVWDSGRGIPQAECDRLFHPFQQGESMDSSKGWGLGLFICRSIVVAHGGSIDVDSDVGKGAIFRITLPLLLPGQPE